MAITLLVAAITLPTPASGGPGFLVEPSSRRRQPFNPTNEAFAVVVPITRSVSNQLQGPSSHIAHSTKEGTAL